MTAPRPRRAATPRQRGDLPPASVQWPAGQFLASLGRRGIVLMRVDGGAILACPGALLTDAEREVIRAHSDELAPLLAEAVVVA
jgi:hypothetical protein